MVITVLTWHPVSLTLMAAIVNIVMLTLETVGFLG